MFCLLLEPIGIFSQPLIFNNTALAQEVVSSVDESKTNPGTAPPEEPVQTDTEEEIADGTSSEKTPEAEPANLEEEASVKGEFALAAAYDGSITLSKGESYKFTNIHTNATYIKSNATSTNTYDYAIYLPDGSGYDYDTDSKSTSRSVRAGGHMVVTVTSSNPVTFTFTTSQVISEASTTPALVKKKRRQERVSRL